MADNHLEVGRNLSLEIDEMKEKITEMTENQAKLEAILQDMRESLNRLGVDRGANEDDQYVNTHPTLSTSSTPIFYSTNTGLTHGIQGHEQHHRTTPIIIPIGEGYRPFERSYHEAPGYAGATWDQPHVYIPVPVTGAQVERGEVKDEWKERIEEQIKAMKGSNTYGPLNIEELCPATGVVIPKDFKIPDFSKYDGSGNPRFHLISYVTKMVIWSREDKFLISFFHESLTGLALQWYLELNHSKILRWTKLADLFMDEYKFNLDATPTREQLSAMQKRSEESFKLYAQRWRSLAAQVQPRLTLSEMCSYFLRTLGAPFIGAMAGAAYEDFSDLIAAGERIEFLSRAGKLD